VREGEIFGLLGPSGAGKSTTQKILFKLLEDYSGSIEYFGRDLKSVGTSFYEDVGVGFEVPVHFTKLTAMENMKFFSGFYQKKADIQELMERVGLWEYRDVKVGEYSKGMKVRLNFVRAMLNNPRVLFLDEVTNGLDPKNARIIKDIIAEYRAQGGTVFLTTHLMNDVEQLCDRIAFCVNGTLHEISTPRELKLRYGKREVRVEYLHNGATSGAVFPLEGIGTNEEFQTILKTKKIETIHSGETSLEEIFIIMTGVDLK
jgi:fluoroquinolone transport system ATP-binding protein